LRVFFLYDKADHLTTSSLIFIDGHQSTRRKNMSQSLQVYTTEDYAYISCPWDDWPLCLSV